MPSCKAAAFAETLHSRQNARLKGLRQRLLRPDPAEDGLVAIEGDHLLREAVHSGLKVRSVYVREDRAADLDALCAGCDAGETQIFLVSAEALNHACATESPQGVAAVVEIRQASLDRMLEAPNPLLAILAGLQDPGNVGAILRTAEAFGVSGVLLTPGTASPWNAKALRASAGSSFRVPMAQLETASLLRRLTDRQMRIYACAARGGVSLEQAAWEQPSAFVIGNEGAGIADEILAFCTARLHIPMPGPVESLNAAVAASIVCYQASRQRAAAAIASRP